MFEVGDVVTFTETEPLWDANACLITFKGNQVDDKYDKKGRPWLVMERVPTTVSGEPLPVYILSLIAKDPNPIEDILCEELVEGALGFAEPDSRFLYVLATIVREKGLEYWHDFAKGGAARKRNINVILQPEWPGMLSAFWNRWKGLPSNLLVKRFQEYIRPSPPPAGTGEGTSS